MPTKYSITFSPWPWSGDTGPIREYIADKKFTASQFVGSATYYFDSFNENTKILNVRVEDNKTEKSLFYHIPGTDAHSRKESGFLGKTYQTYYFSISLDDIKKTIAL